MSLIATFDVGDATTVPSTLMTRQQSKQRSSIYLGDKTDAKSLEKLQQRRITHILNVTPSKKQQHGNTNMGIPNYFEKSGTFQYLRVPLMDDATSVIDLTKQQDTIVNFIHRGLYHGNVLVHCHYGISRSTTCVALYLMR